eukprot:365542-Chlamydomonas_euryale.AAC.38
MTLPRRLTGPAGRHHRRCHILQQWQRSGRHAAGLGQKAHFSGHDPALWRQAVTPVLPAVLPVRCPISFHHPSHKPCCAFGHAAAGAVVVAVQYDCRAVGHRVQRRLRPHCPVRRRVQLPQRCLDFQPPVCPRPHCPPLPSCPLQSPMAYPYPAEAQLGCAALLLGHLGSQRMPVQVHARQQCQACDACPRRAAPRLALHRCMHHQLRLAAPACGDAVPGLPRLSCCPPPGLHGARAAKQPCQPFHGAVCQRERPCDQRLQPRRHPPAAQARCRPPPCRAPGDAAASAAAYQWPLGLSALLRGAGGPVRMAEASATHRHCPAIVA